MTELQGRVMNFVARETALPLKRIQLQSRLLQDFGMDGDDAVEFFQKYGREFGVDVTGVFEEWDTYFFPEGFTRPRFTWFIAAGVAAVGGWMLHGSLHSAALWAAMVLMAGVAVWMLERYFPDPNGGKEPLTVRDLVDAAARGYWTVAG